MMRIRYVPIKRRILYYIIASRIEVVIVASVFLLLGMWYSTQSFSIYDSIITLFATVSIVNSGSLMNYVFDIESR
ncbi:MAG: hypothetical protein J7K13_06025 [Thermoplasmata archaeon]|nr:hypothetical protein [Thermoplasmata archaeon]